MLSKTIFILSYAFGFKSKFMARITEAMLGIKQYVLIDCCIVKMNGESLVASCSFSRTCIQPQGIVRSMRNNSWVSNLITKETDDLTDLTTIFFAHPGSIFIWRSNTLINQTTYWIKIMSIFMSILLNYNNKLDIGILKFYKQRIELLKIRIISDRT